jgi:hypothetical protein
MSGGLVVIAVKFYENVFSGYVGSVDFVLRIKMFTMAMADIFNISNMYAHIYEMSTNLL